MTLEDLKAFPRLTMSRALIILSTIRELYSTEEAPGIIVTDRATLFNLLIGLEGYTISSGVLSSDLNGTNIVAIPLESDEIMK